VNYLTRLALSLDPLDLSLPSSWDYRSEPWQPAAFLKSWIYTHVKIHWLRLYI
jgi:hypothetical protein